MNPLFPAPNKAYHLLIDPDRERTMTYGYTEAMRAERGPLILVVAGDGESGMTVQGRMFGLNEMETKRSLGL